MFSTRAGRRRPAVCGRRDSRRLSRPVGFDPDVRALPVEAVVADTLQRDEDHRPVVDGRRVSSSNGMLHSRRGEPSRHFAEKADRTRHERRVCDSSEVLEAGEIGFS